MIKLISGTSNREFAEAISEILDTPILGATFKSFSDEETLVEIHDNIRGEDVFVIQSTSRPANHNFMELLICIDALKRSSARRITAVIPYYGYARQDSKSGSRTPITAKLTANLLTTAGANRILTIDLHARQIQGFFDIPADNLFAIPIFVKDIKKRFNSDDIIVVSPDSGGVARARALAKKINADLAIVDKRREGANKSEVMNVIGDVTDRRCIIVDDICDTAGTLCNAAQALIDKGALSVDAYMTHGVLSGPAIENLNKADALSSLTITDTIRYPHNIGEESSKIRKVTVAPLFAKAINRIHEESSISELF